MTQCLRRYSLFLLKPFRHGRPFVTVKKVQQAPTTNKTYRAEQEIPDPAEADAILMTTDKPLPHSYLFNGLVSAILLAVVFGVYANTFDSTFAFDDYRNLLENNAIRTNKLSLEGLNRAATESPSHHRWLPNISFALNYYFHGYSPFGYHLINILIHAANCLTLYFLFCTLLSLPFFRQGLHLTATREIAFAAALLWALHPLQTNAVTYIVQRMTSMMVFFYLQSFLFYILARRNSLPRAQKYFFLAVSVFMGCCALMSKENAVLLPLTLLIFDFYFLRSTPDASIRPYLISALLIVSAMLLTGYFLLGGQPGKTILSIYDLSYFTLGERLLTQPRVLFLYISLLLLPLPSRLNLTHDLAVSTSILSPFTTFPALLGFCGLCFLVYFLFHRARLLSFAIVWFLANQIIESSIIPLELVFEHRVYLPSVFLFLVITISLHRFTQSRTRYFRMAILVMASLLALMTWQRNMVWQDEITLWTDIATKSPRSARARIALGKVYLAADKEDKAFEVFQNAHEQGLGSASIYNEWGKLLFKRGQIDQAIIYLKWSIQLDPSNGGAHYNLGIAYGAKGLAREARREMELGLQLMNTR
ncbi:tetratricopeptide repeat protein [Thermodesulfobacteriota bacterium]